MAPQNTALSIQASLVPCWNQRLITNLRWFDQVQCPRQTLPWQFRSPCALGYSQVSQAGLRKGARRSSRRVPFFSLENTDLPVCVARQEFDLLANNAGMGAACCLRNSGFSPRGRSEGWPLFFPDLHQWRTKEMKTAFIAFRLVMAMFVATDAFGQILSRL